MVDCPIPSELSLDLVCENFKSALVDDAYRGKLSITAYCDMKKGKVAVAGACSGIELVCKGDRRARRNAMLEDLILFAVDHKPSNLMVISQDISKDQLFVEHLLTLKKKNRNILLAQIDNVTGELFANVSSIWYWRELSNGGKPTFHCGRSCGVENNTSRSSEGVVGTNEWDLKRCDVNSNTSGSSRGFGDANEWGLRRCDVNSNTSGSSDGVANKRKRSTK